MQSIVKKLLIGAVVLIALVVAVPGAVQRGWLGKDLQDWLRQKRSAWTFDRIYSDPAASFKLTPTDFLRSAIGTAPPGRALDVAMGEGRNAVYLASLGWQVTGFDISQVGLQKARERAQKAGVSIEAVERSADTYDYGKEQWDLILLTYAPVHYDDTGFMQRLRDSAKPGGYVLVETPVEWHHAKGKRPRVPGDLEPGELKSLFPDWEMVYYREAEGTSEWFPRETTIVRMLARKASGPIQRLKLPR